MLAAIDPIDTRTPAMPGAPLVWVLTGAKLGDNAQLRIIAEALGWPCEYKFIQMREPYQLGKPRFKPSLYHIDVGRSAPLAPPWPDLLLTIGRRLGMVALWIRQQSGSRTKVVHVGRPRRWLDRFDLVIATAQYRLPHRPNVLHLEFPLMRIDRAAIAAAAEEWRPRLADLPRPLTALLVGGPTKPFTFDRKGARRLLEMAKRVTEQDGGTLYVTTSRRTPLAAVAALSQGLPPGALLYRWTPDSAANPYRALLGLADRFIVTGDSVSMMVEVARLGKPLMIYPLSRRFGPLGRLRFSLAQLLHPAAGDVPGRPEARLQGLGEALYAMGILGYSRDLAAIHRLLIRRGIAADTAGRFPEGTEVVEDELGIVVERIRSLVQERPALR